MDDYFRLLCAQFQTLLMWTVSREKFGKHPLELSPLEYDEVDRNAWSMTMIFYRLLTPERIQSEAAKPDQKPGPVH
jgi:hypothetical protein